MMKSVAFYQDDQWQFFFMVCGFISIGRSSMTRLKKKVVLKTALEKSDEQEVGMGRVEFCTGTLWRTNVHEENKAGRTAARITPLPATGHLGETRLFEWCT